MPRSVQRGETQQETNQTLAYHVLAVLYRRILTVVGHSLLRSSPRDKTDRCAVYHVRAKGAFVNEAEGMRTGEGHTNTV